MNLNSFNPFAVTQDELVAEYFRLKQIVIAYRTKNFMAALDEELNPEMSDK